MASMLMPFGQVLKRAVGWDSGKWLKMVWLFLTRGAHITAGDLDNVPEYMYKNNDVTINC